MLRHIREHVDKHNWFAVGVDLVIVVLGVFLGTQVSNWNSDRVAQQTGQMYLARMRGDIADNEADMQSRAAYYHQVKYFALEVLGDLDGAARAPDAQFLIDAYQATQIYPRPMQRGTYDEIISAGALDTIGDMATRERIANYYVAMETSEVTLRYVPAYRETARRAIPYAVQERIRTNCAERMDTLASGASRLSLPEQCDLGLSRQDLARAAARVRATQGLELDLTRHLADIDQKLIQFHREEQRARRLGSQLAAKQ